MRSGRGAGVAGLATLGAVALSTNGAQAALVEVGEQSFTRLSDGSLQVTFENGKSIIVPPGDWSIVDGRVFIEETAISQSGNSASDVAAVSGGGGNLTSLSFNNPLVIATGGALLGYYFADRDSDSGSSGSSTTPSDFQASGTVLTGTISNDRTKPVTMQARKSLQIWAGLSSAPLAPSVM